MRPWAERLCNVIWPTTRCVICGGASEKLYPGLCPSCLERMVRHREESLFCPRCGTFYGNSFRACPHCYFDRPRYLKNGIFCALPYDEDSRILVKKLKYDNRRDLAEAMVKLFFRYSGVDHDFDMVTSVPLHKTRLRQRGYNQSEELARRIAADMELPYMPLLQRTRETPSQTRLTLSQRRKNPIGAFSVLPDAVVEGKRILLIDDVVTTGATALECVTVLRAKGAKRVAIGGICAGRSREGYSSSNV